MTAGKLKELLDNTCTHNIMTERKDDFAHAWECADCGYVYGQAGPISQNLTPSA